MTYRMLTDEELGNWDRWHKAHPHGPRINPEGGFDTALGKSRDGHPLARKAIDLRHFAKNGAFDTAGEESDGGELSPLHRLVRAMGALDPESFEDCKGEFLKMLRGSKAEAKPKAEDDLPDNGLADPKAMDSAAARLAFDSQFPRANRVRSVDYGRQPERRAKPVTATAAASFAEMFPNSKPVRRV